MRRRLAVALASLALLAPALLAPALASAHGGSSKNVGNAVVFLTQSPISPLVGEDVRMTFSLTDRDGKPLAGIPVEMDLIDTFYGDASKDRLMLKNGLVTDANGSFDFDQTFGKENYFDVELHFKDPVTGEDDATGFLIQPRAAKPADPQAEELRIIAAVAAGAVVGAIVMRWKMKRKTARASRAA